MTQPPRPHALYRFYDADNQLLYVGITLNPTSRWTDHRNHKPWWTHVTRITLEHHPDRDTVLAAERAAITNERPRHNILHNGRTRPAPEPAWGSTAEHMPDDCHDQCVKAGSRATYFPHRWHDGIAHYQCRLGHQWTCGWGHHHTGAAPELRGVPVEVYP